MEIVGEKKRVCWLTPAQYDYLLSAFQHTRNGYSDNSVSVVGVFDDENGYYIRCRAERVAQPHKHHTPLITEATIDDSLRDH